MGGYQGPLLVLTSLLKTHICLTTYEVARDSTLTDGISAKLKNRTVVSRKPGNETIDEDHGFG